MKFFWNRGKSTSGQSAPNGASASNDATASSPEAIGPDIFMKPGTNPRVDIVFLHGLTGHRDKTWMVQGEAQPWPKALLSKDLPTARIILYGYDADVIHLTRPAGQNTVHDHARNLVNDLASCRREAVGRPIIFVVHSLGGIVCQDALLTCVNPSEEAQRDILLSTRGVAFLGTPHAGADLAKFAEAVVNIVRCSVIKKPNKNILKVLQKNSEVLAQIKDGFHIMVQRRLEDSPKTGVKPIRLHAFVEELDLAFLGRRVVEPDSAKIPGWNFNTIHANHMDMTKFCKATDQGYIRILDKLKDWIGDDLIDDKLYGLHYRDAVCGVLHLTCANSEPSKAVKQLCEALRVEKSFEWFIQSSEFRIWSDGKSSKLWLQGERWSGKTVILSYILRSLSQPILRSDEQDIASVFCSSEDSEIAIVASLTFQLLQNSEVRAKIARTKFPISAFEQHDKGNPLQRFWVLLKESIAAVGNSNTPTVLIIDGVDHLKPSARYTFLSNLNKLARDVDIKVLISSEDNSALREALGNYSTIDREKERRKCLGTLEFNEWKAREVGVKTVEEAGKVFFEDPEFTKWKECPKSSAFWLKGKPGSGKSTLAKHMLPQLESHTDDLIPRPTRETKELIEREREDIWSFKNPKDTRTIVARFFYSARGGSSQTSHELMLRSIVYQIWKSNSKLFPHIRDRYRKLTKPVAADEENNASLWHSGELKSTLQSLHLIDFDLDIFIVVDAMDESDKGKQESIIDFLLELVNQESRCIIKIFIAGRPEADVSSRPLWQTVGGYQVTLEKLNHDDIEGVVESWIKELSPSDGKSGKFSTIKDYVVQHALGVFLWVSLVLDDLQKCIKRGGYSKADLEIRLKGLPKELTGPKGFYRAMIDDLVKEHKENKDITERGQRIFAWVTFAERPISLEELRDVLAVPKSEIVDLSEYNLEFNKPDDLEKGILSYCGGLVEVRGDDSEEIVQLIHQTVREFLLDEGNFAKPYDLDEIRGDAEIATTCCRYNIIIFSSTVLLANAKVEDILEFRGDRQATIARRIESRHTDEISISSSKEMAALEVCTDSEVFRVIDYLNEQSLLLYALTSFSTHVDNLKNKYSEPYIIQRIDDEFGRFVKRLMEQKGSYSYVLLCQWLNTLKLNWSTTVPTDVNDESTRKLLRCLLNHYVYTSEELLQRDSFLRERFLGVLLALRTDLLHAAVEIEPTMKRRYGKVFKILLQTYGADLSSTDASGHIPFWYAERTGDRQLVGVLLDGGIDRKIFSVDKDGPIWLLYAVRARRGDALRRLVTFGVDVNTMDAEGRTPISYAAQDGDEEIAAILLRAGADVTSADSKGRTPIWYATEAGHEDLTIMLSEGIDSANADGVEIR